MKKLAALLILLFCTGCGSPAASFQAVYFVRGQGQLSSGDLKAHPQVIVVHTFDELKKASTQKIALWIDQSATPFEAEQEKWINEAPQAYYPIVLVGTSDTLHSFRDLLKLCCFMGPIIEWDIEPGFSIIQREPPADPTTAAMDVPFIHGYDQTPTVQSILEITNDLLEGKIRPTPISTLPQPPVQIETAAIHQIILYDEQPSKGFPSDAAKINRIYLPITANILTMDVAYQGNCKEHSFELYAATAFLQSNPPQAVLYLAHDSHEDACNEKVEQELSFDLTPLDRERNDPSEHPLLLRIYEPVGGAFSTEPVMPFIEWP